MKIFIIIVTIINIQNEFKILVLSNKIENPSLVSVFEYIEKCEKTFIVEENQNLTLFLGITGGGKSTSIKILTDPNLKTKRTGPGKYIFSDNNQKIGEITGVSKTSLPEIFEDRVNGLTYVDNPGFEDTRGVLSDIGTTYFIDKLLKKSHSINFVLVVNAWAVEITGGQRNEFLNFLTQITSLMKNPEKYRNAITLLVTKVDNNREEGILIPDSEIITEVAKFLNQTLIVLQEENDERERRGLSIIVESLLTNANDRIGIFRKPETAGDVKNMPIFVAEAQRLTTIIKNMPLIKTNEGDFFYTLSDRSQYLVRDNIDIIDNDIIEKMLNIINKMKQFYQTKENGIIVMQQFYNDINLALTTLNTTSITKFDNIVSSVDVFISGALKFNFNFVQNDKIVGYLKLNTFLKKLINNNRTMLSMQTTIKNEINDLLKYLFETEIWYKFLVDLYQLLTKTDADNWQILANKDYALEMSKNAFLQFLGTLRNEMICRRLNNIEEINFNRIQRFILLKKHFLDYEISSNNINCDNGIFRIRGNNIKISQVIANTCWKLANRIEIIALNRIYFDTDAFKEAKDVKFSIIAPNWRVENNVSIVMKGLNGKIHNPNAAGTSHSESINGYPGLPGLPGDSGGAFFGVQFYTNAKQLNIKSVGGTGGPGQHGGKGFYGKKGTDAIYKRNCDDPRKCENPKNEIIHGDAGKNGTNGGDGGIGGKGGNSGEIDVVGLFEKPAINIRREQGAAGAKGAGGQGGNTIIGVAYEIGYSSYMSASGWSSFHMECCSHFKRQIPGETIQSANGTDGKNEKDIKEPITLHFSNKCEAINDFIAFMRESLSISPLMKEYIIKISNSFLENAKIKTLYTTQCFVMELENMEKNYQTLRKDNILYISILESLKKRIVEYINSNKNNLTADETKILRYLYVTITSKMFAIKNNANQNTVFDLLQYIRTIKIDINSLKEFKQSETIQSYQTQYNASLYRKIESAQYIIETYIIPETKSNTRKLEEDIYKILTEVHKRENITRENLKKIQDTQAVALIFAGFKIVSGIATIFTPFGTAASIALPYAESVLVPNSDNILPTTTTAMRASIGQISESYKAEKQTIQNGLNEIEQMFDEFITHNKNDENIKEIANNIKKSKTEILKLSKNEDIDNPERLSKLMAERDRLETYLNEKKSLILKSKPQREARIERKVQLVNRGIKIVNALDITANAINDIRKIVSNDKLKECEKDLKALKQLEDNVYNEMFPVFENMEKFSNSLSEDLEGKHHFELDLKKMRLQQIFRDAKVLFQKMSKGFAIEQDLQRSISRMEECMEILIDIYDRIDSYADSVTLTKYMSSLANVNVFEDVGPYTDSIQKLKSLIKSNLILERYETAVKSYKQKYFPHSYEEFHQLDVPNELQLNDTNVTINYVVEQIQNLNTRLSDINSSHRDQDNYMINDENVVFYEWQDMSLIRNLLNGSEIVVQADILNGTHKNAVKFKNIGIRFQFENDNDANEFNKLINKFTLNLKMLGNNYYRCRQKIYYFSMDKTILIKYSFANNKINNKPIMYNDSWEKINKNIAFLSPYTLWAIQLESQEISFDEIKQYADKVTSLELFGDCKYLNNDNYTDRICNDNLDDFYHSYIL